MQPKIDKLEIWKARRLEFQKSGLTRRVYCKKNKIKESTLDYWFYRIGKLNKTHGLIEIQPRSIESSSMAIVVAVGRFRIEVNNDAAVQILAQTVKALESLG